MKTDSAQAWLFVILSAGPACTPAVDPSREPVGEDTSVGAGRLGLRGGGFRGGTFHGGGGRR